MFGPFKYVPDLSGIQMVTVVQILNCCVQYLKGKLNYDLIINFCDLDLFSPFKYRTSLVFTIQMHNLPETSANRGPDSRFVLEAIIKPLISKLS